MARVSRKPWNIGRPHCNWLHKASQAYESLAGWFCSLPFGESRSHLFQLFMRVFQVKMQLLFTLWIVELWKTPVNCTINKDKLRQIQINLVNRNNVGIERFQFVVADILWWSISTEFESAFVHCLRSSHNGTILQYWINKHFLICNVYSFVISRSTEQWRPRPLRNYGCS